MRLATVLATMSSWLWASGLLFGQTAMVAPGQEVSCEEVAAAIASVSGRTLIVDWHGTWDYATIQEALDASTDGDTIIVLPSTGSSAGAYVENVVFPAKAVTLRSINPQDSDIVAATVIDGNAAGSVVSFKTGTPPQAALQGFTLRNGTGTASQRHWYGGGIYCVSCSRRSRTTSSPETPCV